MNPIKLFFLEASYGDSLLFEFDNDTTLLIDGGTKVSMHQNIEVLRKSYSKHKNNYILLTHIDNDHINGIIYLFERCEDIYQKVNGVIFNTSEDLKSFIADDEKDPPSICISCENDGYTGYSEGKQLEHILAELNISVYSNIVSGTDLSINGIDIKILSPSIKSFKGYQSWIEEQEEAYTGIEASDYSQSIEELIINPFKEDASPTNLSSISILIDYKDKKILLLGDSVPSDIVVSLVDLGYSKDTKLNLDILKVSHHGSKHNTSTELLEMIDCKKFLISTNGKKYQHPDKECLARIIKTQDCPELIFNYDIYDCIFSKEEKESGLFTIKEENEVDI